MLSKSCRLDESGIICCENKKENLYWKKPKPELYTNIPMLWSILESIVQDWNREAEPFQLSIDKSVKENERIYYIGQVFLKLPPHYFKCLFSYVLFFVSLESAYDLLYEELNALNRLPIFKVKHHKKPQRSSYIEKVRSVRNISIAHIGSKEVPPIDARAGMMWEPLSLAKSKDTSWNINQLSFGSGKLSTRDSAGNITKQSVDLEIQGIPALHSQCMDYIDRYDEVCANYLEALAEKLPIDDGDNRYSVSK